MTAIDFRLVWNRMERKGAALLLFLPLVLSIGCQDLEFADPNDPTLDNPPSAQKLVTGIEAGMRVDLAIYLRVVEVFGRQVYYLEPADPRYTGELLRGPIDAGGFLLNRSWNARYRAIKNCTELTTLPSERGVSEEGKRGFANTILAYQLLLNLNLTDVNGVKIVFSDDVTTPFASKEESLAEIARLLDTANGDLTTAAGAGDDFGFVLSSGFAGFNKPSTFARFNRGLRARVAAYQSDWATTLNALNGSFVDVGAPLSLGVYHVFSTGANDQTNETWESPTAASVKLVAHPTFRAQAEAGDLRFSSKTVARPDTILFDNLRSNLAVNILESSVAPIPVVRNEELLLLRAEANIAQGNLGVAEADINVVRAAAGLPAVTLNAANALNQLLYERRYSLFMEGHRWVDMRRYGRLNELPLDRAGDVVFPAMPRPESEVTGG